jgi:hypothetical protein
MLDTLHRSTIVLLLSLGVATLGCAAMRGMSAKHAYLEQETNSHVYNRPLKEVWPQARQLLFERGFEVKDTDASNAETEWKLEANKKDRERYLLSGIEVGPTECKVQFTKATEYLDKGEWRHGDTGRDLKAELDLIQKAEPDVYSAMQAEGDKRADKAKNED